jgi:hypothetical protein
MRSSRRIKRAIDVLMLASLLGEAGGCVSRQDETGDIAVPVAAVATPGPAEPAAPAQDGAAAPSGTTAATMTPAETATATPGAEQITVVGRSFTGLWKVNSPKRLGMDVGLLSGVHIHYSGDTGDRDICELSQTGSSLAARCLRLARTAVGSIDGNEITLRSWIGPANLILRASAQSGSSLQGSVSGGALGTQMTGGVPIRATKLTVPPTGTERPSAPLVRDVLADIGAGRLTAGRYGVDAAIRLKRDLGDMRAEQGELGPLRSMTYLDQLLPRHPYDPRERPLEVYRIDYANGTRLCGISPGAADTVEDFICR